jgi:hypothetical protein
MNDVMLNIPTHIRSLIRADDLRPALLLGIGQTIIALLGALLITNGVLT